MDNNKIFCAVVADDITGANDIGIMFAKTNIETVVYSQNKLDESFLPSYAVTIIDTNSRFSDYKVAYDRVYQAVKKFNKEEVKTFYNKQCSVFRGNIGAEFDGMLDALEEDHAMVIAGFPDNGRTTIKGIHYVNGVELSESQFRNDPVNPMVESNLVKLVQSQTKRKVCLISFEKIDLGLEKLKEEIKLKKRDNNYLIFDVRNNEDLAIIAKAIAEEKVVCGSSAIAYYLSELHKEFASEKIEKSVYENDRILTIAGSLTPQTKSQINYIKNKNYPVITLDTKVIFDKQSREQEVNRILSDYDKFFKESRMVLIHSANSDEDVAKTKSIGKSKNFNNTMVSELVSETLGNIAFSIKNKYNVEKYIVCGGDTSASFCNRMDVKGMKVLEEIQAGLPSCETITEPYLKLVLKSGSFGSEDFLLIGMDYL